MVWLDWGGGSGERVSGTAGRGTGGRGKWGAGEDSGAWRTPLRGWRDRRMGGRMDGWVEVEGEMMKNRFVNNEKADDMMPKIP